MKELNIYNEDGRKYTLTEYFKKVTKEGYFQIESMKYGTLVAGTYEQIKGDLREVYFSACIQKIEKTTFGLILYLR